MTLKEYRDKIKKAKTSDELTQIAYEAFLQDDRALRSRNSLYNKVVTACVLREQELAAQT